MDVKIGVAQEVLEGICNCTDICDQDQCPYHQTSPEATKKCLEAIAAQWSPESKIRKDSPPEYCPHKGKIIFD